MRCWNLRKQAMGSVVVAGAVLALAAPAEARRGLSAAQIKAIQAQQQAEVEAEMKYQAALTAKRKEIFDRYDLNKNGKIDGTEKPMLDKYLRAVKLGKEPDPLLAIAYPKIEVKKTTSGSSKTSAAKK